MRVYCRAVSPDGWVCEGKAPDHAGPHQGGDERWYGSDPDRERQTDVWDVLSDDGKTTEQLAHALGWSWAMTANVLCNCESDGEVVFEGGRWWAN